MHKNKYTHANSQKQHTGWKVEIQTEAGSVGRESSLEGQMKEVGFKERFEGSSEFYILDSLSLTAYRRGHGMIDGLLICLTRHI